MSDLTVPNERGSVLERLAMEVEPDAVIQEVRIGPFVTAVRTTAGTGVATTLLEQGPHAHHSGVALAGRLGGMSVVELVARSGSGSNLDRSVALAAANGSIRQRPRIEGEGNGFDLLARLGAGKRVVVIGHFPFVESERVRAFSSCDVFELPDRARPGDRTAEELPFYLGRADLVVITGTTLVTNTLEQILGLCSESAIRLMLGPTTPLSPLLFESGLDALCGSLVDSPSTVMEGAGQGATHKQLEGLRKVICLKPGAGL